MAWVVDFYEDARGSAPVEDYLEGLPVKQRAKLLALVEILKAHGPTLPFPYSSQVEGRLRELRTQLGKTKLRILYYCDSHQRFQLLHGVVKDTATLEKADIKKANDRLSDHEKQMSIKDKKPREK